MYSVCVVVQHLQTQRRGEWEKKRETERQGEKARREGGGDGGITAPPISSVIPLVSESELSLGGARRTQITEFQRCCLARQQMHNTHFPVRVLQKRNSDITYMNCIIPNICTCFTGQAADNLSSCRGGQASFLWLIWGFINLYFIAFLISL